jgi:hypothetical protein
VASPGTMSKQRERMIANIVCWLKSRVRDAESRPATVSRKVKAEEDEGKEQEEMLDEMFNLPRDGVVGHTRTSEIHDASCIW